MNELEPIPGEPREYRFKGAYDCVHLDEKWFFLSEENQRLYLVLGEDRPHRTVAHKSHIIKVMFLAAVARPRYDAHGVMTFDRKIGLFPFVEKVRAQRSSKNRAAGTLETKAVTCDKEEYLRKVVDQVIPAIKEKWPDRRPNYSIGLQHGNATPHNIDDEFDWIEASMTDMRWSFHLSGQAANSPDQNILDLGFFRALQSLQWQQEPARTDQLIANVMKAWHEFDPVKINYNFLTHQLCMEQSLLKLGNNDYKIPHMGKASLDRQGALPRRIVLCEEAVDLLEEEGFLE